MPFQNQLENLRERFRKWNNLYDWLARANNECGDSNFGRGKAPDLIRFLKLRMRNKIN